MAGGWTDDFNQDVMQTVVDATGAPATLTDSTWFAHLYHTTLNSAATPATTGRCPGGNYTPVKFTNSTATWTAPSASSASSVQNKVTLTFTTDASTGWADDGALKSFLLTSSSGTGGTAYYWADLDSQQTVSAGNTVRFSTGSIVLTSHADTG